MSIKTIIPPSSRFNSVDVTFLSAFNIPRPGLFDFSYYERFLSGQVSAGAIRLLGNWPVGTVVNFAPALGGALDTAVSARVNYYVVSNVQSVFFGYRDVAFSATPGGVPLVFALDGAGVLIVSPVYPIVNMVRGLLYFIERINVGGTIAQETYLSAIDVVPTVTLFRSGDGQSIYPHPLPLVNFLSNQEANAWLWTQRDSEVLQASVAGILSPTIDLVGVTSISLSCQFNIYEVIDTAFIKTYGGAWNGSNR
jgi:hypothetical protein